MQAIATDVSTYRGLSVCLLYLDVLFCVCVLDKLVNAEKRLRDCPEFGIKFQTEVPSIWEKP